MTASSTRTAPTSRPRTSPTPISRSFAIEELPDGPTYQLQFFLDGDKYEGPYQEESPYRGVEVDGSDITIKMSQPFPAMDYYASFPVFTAIPEAKDTKDEYGAHPIATGPYMFEEDLEPGGSLTLVKNPHWDPATDPGRIQSVDKWVFKFGEDTARLENAILSDIGETQTTLSYDNIRAPTYKRITERAPDRLVTGNAPCTFMWYLDMRKITDIKVRKAIGYAYPYVDVWKASGEIVGVTRVPGTSILPPGTAGRVEYDVLGIGGQDTDPAKAKELLTEANAMGFELKFLYPADDPLQVAAKDQLVKGLEEGGFTATAIPSTSGVIRDAVRDPDEPDQRALERLVLGLAVWQLVVPGPVARLARRTGRHAQPFHVRRTGGRRATARDPLPASGRVRCRLGGVGQVDPGDLLPRGGDGLRRHRDDPGFPGRRDAQRQRAWHADVPDHVRHRRAVSLTGRPRRCRPNRHVEPGPRPHVAIRTRSCAAGWTRGR